MKHARWMGSCLAAWLAGWSASADVHYVSIRGGNIPPYTTLTNAARSIQNAINASADNDEVWIDAGTYFERVSIFEKSGLKLKGTQGAALTVIDAQQKGAGIHIGWPAVDTTVQGLTVKNGATYAGIVCLDRATIQDCFIVNNAAVGVQFDQYCAGSVIQNCKIAFNRGSGIAGYRVAIINCAIYRNDGINAGRTLPPGVGVSISESVMTDCQIFSNGVAGVSDSAGGGVACVGSTLNNCHIYNNRAARGGGIYCYSQSGLTGLTTINNCQIRNNIAGSDGGGLCCSEPQAAQAFNCKLNACVLDGNEAYNYGGGVFGLGGVELDRCTLSDNRAYYGGGGGAFAGTGNALNSCTIKYNKTTGGAEGCGGGLYAECPANGLAVADSLLLGNLAYAGAAYYGTGFSWSGCVEQHNLEVEGPSGYAVGIGCGIAHSLAIMEDGAVYAWGDNRMGQLGDGTMVNAATPTLVKGLSLPIAVGGGSMHSWALREDGSLWMWGYNYYGQLGDGTTRSRQAPHLVPGLPPVKATASGHHHILALTEDGTVWSWGWNQDGQLGDNTTQNRLSPARVPGLSNIVAVAAGALHSVALMADGTVWAWGNNGYGQLGNGTYQPSRIPQRVINLDDVVALGSAGDSSGAVKRDGTTWLWGRKTLGQGTVRYDVAPMQEVGINGAQSLVGGPGFWLALQSSGQVWSWGRNQDGQLGDGSFASTAIPKPIEFAIHGTTVAQAVAVYHNHALALRDGEVWAWGDNSAGQVGDGTTLDKNTPVPITFPAEPGL